jgi:hypothetical protein
MRQRHGAALAAVALCLGGALTACGGGSGDGYVAVGAAASTPEEAPTGAVPPQGKVVLVPLDGATQADEEGRRSPAASNAPEEGKARDPQQPGSPGLPAVPGSGGTSGSIGTGSPGGSPGSPAVPGTPGTTPPKPAPTPAPTPTTPAGPAVLSLGEPVRAALDRRWCEKATVEFHNTGGSPVASGAVTFATHIIGALGIDWATVESTQPLPAPIAAGAVQKKAYTVCVDAWRVPLGMHIETQDVTAVWK